MELATIMICHAMHAFCYTLWSPVHAVPTPQAYLASGTDDSEPDNEEQQARMRALLVGPDDKDSRPSSRMWAAAAEDVSRTSPQSPVVHSCPWPTELHEMLLVGVLQLQQQAESTVHEVDRKI